MNAIFSLPLPQARELRAFLENKGCSVALGVARFPLVTVYNIRGCVAHGDQVTLTLHEDLDFRQVSFDIRPFGEVTFSVDRFAPVV